MIVVSLSFSAALLWGFADFLGGMQSRRRPLLVVLGVMQLAALVPVTAVLVAHGDPAPGGRAVAWSLAAGLGGGLGLAAFYRGLAVGTMSIVAPIGAMGVLVPVLAALAEGERPATVQLAGIVLALGGVVLASREPAGSAGDRPARAGLAGDRPSRPGAAGDRPSRPGPAGDGPARAGVGLALAAACGMGIALLGTGRATGDAGAAWTLLLSRAPQLVAVWLLIAWRRPQLPAGPRAVAPLVALGLIDVGANALFAVATTKGLLSVASVVSSIYPAFTVLLARAVLGERVTRVQDVGIVATLAGVVAISAG